VDKVKIPEDLQKKWNTAVFFGEPACTEYRALIERIARLEQAIDTRFAAQEIGTFKQFNNDPEKALHAIVSHVADFSQAVLRMHIREQEEEIARLTADLEHTQSSRHDLASAHTEDMLTIDRLSAETMALKARAVGCIFCREVFSTVAELKDHSATCAKHPAVIREEAAEAQVKKLSAPVSDDEFDLASDRARQNMRGPDILSLIIEARLAAAQKGSNGDDEVAAERRSRK